MEETIHDFLCKSCQRSVKRSQAGIARRNKKFRPLFEALRGGILNVSFYARKRSQERRIPIDLNKINRDSELIEVQSGMCELERKFIVRTVIDEKIIHFVILVVAENNGFTTKIINVYNPLEGMSFKWDQEGRERVYFNSLRKCCVHPNDDKSNFNKRHHGIRHKHYSYQNK